MRYPLEQETETEVEMFFVEWQERKSIAMDRNDLFST